MSIFIIENENHGLCLGVQIFCAKCGSKDLTLDNDIILCDGACERGFHQFCLEPPLLKTDSNIMPLNLFCFFDYFHMNL